MKKLIILLLTITTLNSYSQIDSLTIINYYDTIVYYHELSPNKSTYSKFQKDIKIFVKGNKINYLEKELEKIVFELNELIDPINILITSDSTDYNILIFLGTRKEFCKINMDFDDMNKTGIQGFGITYSGRQHQIYGADAFVDIGRVKNPIRQKHILREELTQCLGLLNDTEQYPNSIFYEIILL